MDNREIRELAVLMSEMGLTSLEYQNGAESVKLTRPAENLLPAISGVNASQDGQRGEESSSGNVFTVKSPMVGLFYSAPGLDEEPYVAVGCAVNAGDVLCMIEAMKIMNEITAERDGVITEICVENRQIVEYGQPLFKIGRV